MGWQVYALGSALFAGMTAIFGKLGLEGGVNTNVATFLRTAMILLLVGIVVTARTGWSAQGLDGRSVGFLSLAGLATGVSWMCYFKALSMGKAAQVDPVDKLAMVVSVMLAFFFLKERLPWTGWAGVALIASGTLLMLRT
jgi:transporter family protein